MIAGKGHEQGQLIGDRRLPFDDREVAAEVLRDLGWEGRVVIPMTLEEVAAACGGSPQRLRAGRRRPRGVHRLARRAPGPALRRPARRAPRRRRVRGPGAAAWRDRGGRPARDRRRAARPPGDRRARRRRRPRAPGAGGAPSLQGPRGRHHRQHRQDHDQGHPRRPRASALRRGRHERQPQQRDRPAADAAGDHAAHPGGHRRAGDARSRDRSASSRGWRCPTSP